MIYICHPYIFDDNLNSAVLLFWTLSSSIRFFEYLFIGSFLWPYVRATQGSPDKPSTIRLLSRIEPGPPTALCIICGTVMQNLSPKRFSYCTPHGSQSLTYGWSLSDQLSRLPDGRSTVDINDIAWDHSLHLPMFKHRCNFECECAKSYTHVICEVSVLKYYNTCHQ